MKNAVLLLIVLVSLFSARSSIQAQQIINSGFEWWNYDTLSHEPVGWGSSNFLFWMEADLPPQVEYIEDAYEGSRALKLSAGIFEGETVPSIVISNGREGLFEEEGGFPYSQAPTGISLWQKSNLLPGDTAVVFVRLVEEGTVIMEHEIQIAENFSNWTEQTFSFPAYVGTPDTAVLYIVLGDFGEVSLGSELMIDKLSFSGPGVTEPIPNGGFEDWITFSAHEPLGWRTSNFFGFPWGITAVTRSTDSHTGSYSLRIESADSNLFGSPFGYAGTGRIGAQGPLGGIPYSAEPDKISFWYKYTPVGTDTALAFVRFTHWNMAANKRDTLLEFSEYLPANPSWTLREVDFLLSGAPDSVIVAFASSNPGGGGAHDLGSLLYIDDVQFSGGTVAADKFKQSAGIKVYPQPATGETMIFDLGEVALMEHELKVYDLKGLLIHQAISSESQISMSTAGIPNGVYIYRLTTVNAAAWGKLVIRK